MLFRIVSSSLTALFLGLSTPTNEPLPPINLLSWDETTIFKLPTEPDAKVEAIVNNYLKKLSTQGIIGENQQVWIQSDWVVLGDYQGEKPASAASLTKIATSLAVLEKWGANHQFETKIYLNGNLNEGILTGDLIVVGDSDPLFVWEEGIALGNFLSEKGIKQIKGNLIITGNFAMNFKSNSQTSGELLKQALNYRLWSSTAYKQYRSLPENTPKPEIIISGNVRVENNLTKGAKLLLIHKSMTLAELLKQMNIYSNNVMAEMLAQTLGGGQVVASMAALAAEVPSEEIQLINGSGLGLENRISPRAAVAMLMAIERKLLDSPLSVADLFPVGGRDVKGTMQDRNIPDGVAIKTGTLNLVSALAGVIPTKERGQVWFAIINSGYQIPKFRVEQDNLLQKLSEHWQFTNPEIKPNPNPDYLGNPKRISYQLAVSN